MTVELNEDLKTKREESMNEATPIEMEIAIPAIVANDETREGNFIPESVYEGLPSLLKDSTNVFNEKRERDVFLIGAITALGGCFYNARAFNEADKKGYSPNLFSFIVAPPASGKGALNYSRKLIDKIVETFEIGKRGKLIIPANNSSAGVVSMLGQNRGNGVMIESEIDTIVNSQRQEWGNYSEILRKGFENENYQYFRKGKNEYIDIKKVKLSLAISGTVDQFKNLIHSTDNGLFSRGCYYIFDEQQPLKCYGRMNVESSNVEKQFEEFANIANEYYEKIESLGEVIVSFNESQLKEIEDKLRPDYDQIQRIQELQSNVKRVFITIQKVATIISILEKEPDDIAEMNCSETALKLAIEFTMTLLRHSYKVYEILPKVGKKKLPVSATRLLAILPDKFTRAEGLELSKQLKISPRTYDEGLKNLKESRLIIPLNHGVFTKVA